MLLCLCLLSTSEDSDEDPEIVQKMAMLSNRLQYLAKKNKRFLSRSSGHKGSRKEDKGCFNCKKIGHFIAECPDLQKDKSKKPIYKANKFKKQIKKSLMVTWEDLDNESESDKEDAEDEAKVAMAFVTARFLLDLFYYLFMCVNCAHMWLIAFVCILG